MEKNIIQSKISIALIGTGLRGSHIVGELLRLDINTNKLIDKLYLWDSQKVACDIYYKQFKEQFGEIVISQAQTLQEILENKNIKWVFIASKNSEHCSQALQALKHKKHIFCEKPLATTIDDCVKMKNAVYEEKRYFIIGLVLRYAQIYKKIKEILNSKVIGNITSIQQNETLNPYHGGYIFMNWRRFKDQAGPHILEKCCHDIDILNWMTESTPEYVSAFGGNTIFTKENGKEIEKDNNMDIFLAWDKYENVTDPFSTEKTIEDNLVTILKYRNGINATFHTNCNVSLPQRQIYICGIKGTIKADAYAGKITLKLLGKQKEKFSTQGGGHSGGDSLMLDYVYGIIKKSIQEESHQSEFDFKNLETSIDHCFISTISCLAIDEAREKNQVIDLKPVWAKFKI